MPSLLSDIRRECPLSLQILQGNALFARRVPRCAGALAPSSASPALAATAACAPPSPASRALRLGAARVYTLVMVPSVLHRGMTRGSQRAVLSELAGTARQPRAPSPLCWTSRRTALSVPPRTPRARARWGHASARARLAVVMGCPRAATSGCGRLARTAMARPPAATFCAKAARLA